MDDLIGKSGESFPSCVELLSLYCSGAHNFHGRGTIFSVKVGRQSCVLFFFTHICLES